LRDYSCADEADSQTDNEAYIEKAKNLDKDNGVEEHNPADLPKCFQIETHNGTVYHFDKLYIKEG
jgi:hypothetical protein